MTSTLVLCSGCLRHFRARDAACPFCGAASAEARPPRPAPLAAGASRSRRYAVRAAFIVAGVTAGCSGEPAGGATGFGGQACEGKQNPTGQMLCRTNANCTSPETCFSTMPTQGCRPNFQPQECGNGTNCQAGFACSAGDCGGHTCIPECDPATCTGTNTCSNGLCVAKACDVPGAAACEPGTVCDPGASGATTTGCAPVHCSDTDPCEKNQDCVAAQTGRGCVTRPCTTDSECDCGYCVNSQCQATLGFCYQIVATPYGCVWPDEELV
jgi:hypothetical protein